MYSLACDQYDFNQHSLDACEETPLLDSIFRGHNALQQAALVQGAGEK